MQGTRNFHLPPGPYEEPTDGPAPPSSTSADARAPVQAPTPPHLPHNQSGLTFRPPELLLEPATSFERALGMTGRPTAPPLHAPTVAPGFTTRHARNTLGHTTRPPGYIAAPTRPPASLAMSARPPEGTPALSGWPPVAAATMSWRPPGGAPTLTERPSAQDEVARGRLTSLERAVFELRSRVEGYERALRRAEAETDAASASLQATNARLLAVTHGAADAILTLGDDGRIEELNPAAERLFGRAPHEMVGRSFETLLPEHTLIDFETLAGAADAPLPPGAVGGRHEASDGQLRRDDAPPAPGASAEIRGRRADGTAFPMHVTLNRVRLEGRPLFLAIVRDVSEQRRAEAEHQELNRRVVVASRQAGMAEIASNVLHNVGNVLNSVNVSATVLAGHLASSRAFALEKIASLMREHEHDIGVFLHEDPRGKLLPQYLERLGEALVDEHRAMSAELESLRKDVEHIKQIVRTQQSFARTNADVRELVAPHDLMEEALRIAGHTSSVNEAVEVVREYDAVPDVRLDRHKVVHIIVNLISNARHAIAAAARGGQIRLCINPHGEAHVRLDVVDNGVGIPEENLVRVFNYGFTTRPEGHGFGLHGAALWAKELGGTLAAHSLGAGRGARFSLVLPVDHAPARPEHEGA